MQIDDDDNDDDDYVVVVVVWWMAIGGTNDAGSGIGDRDRHLARDGDYEKKKRRSPGA